LLTSAVVAPVYACRTLGMSLPRFLVNIVLRGAIVGSAFAALCRGALMVFPARSWWWFGADVAMVLVAYLPIAWWLLVPAADRTRILDKGKSLIRTRMRSQNASSQAGTTGQAREQSP
jgi:hypothetical protein